MPTLRRTSTTIVALALLSIASRAVAQVPEPDGGGVKRGVLPRSWQVSGPACPDKPTFQVHAYNDDFFILRESGCTNYEKPFLFLLFGTQRALLLDTGAGTTDVALVVEEIVGRWLSRNRRATIDLIVAHTHAHKDHIAGDEQLRGMPRTSVVPPTLAGVQSFFHFRNWPTQISSYDLGNRVLDLIPIPGHEASSIAVYDRETAILFTGDTLYPGRLYVQDAAAFTQSVQRLVDFTHDKVVAHILGNHVEQARTPYLDYPIGTVYQPDEHQLELGRSQLLELNEALRGMNGNVRRMAYRDFTIWPD